MQTVGQLCLLGVFVGSGYAAFASFAGWRCNHSTLRRTGWIAGLASALMLTATIAILAWALYTKDGRFAYVGQYTSESLSWYYCLSALWVGQAGSLLLWAWFLGWLALAFRFSSKSIQDGLREPAFAILMAYFCFLVATMVFAADPMEPSLAVRHQGSGLSPLLQHPAMLIHPPIIFLGYACWAVPFALATAALISGQLDGSWARAARPWAMLAWCVLGGGILLGADWAYEELGWGGYWGWDPVENGSLIPWLIGTALIHTLMAWQHRGVLKKTAMMLAIAAFGLCNFATFLTRSGIFSSLHAFSQSPIGWLFLVLMIVLALGGSALIVLRRAELRSERTITSVWSRESMVVIATVALTTLAVTACVGTLSAALSDVLVGRKIVVGIAFYNNVLIPIGLLLLSATAMAPLLKWGTKPSQSQKSMLWFSAGIAAAATVLAFVLDVRHPISLAVAFLVAFAAAALVAALLLDARRRQPGHLGRGCLQALRESRRQYAGFVVHVGLFCLAIGITGSSLGSRSYEAVMREGETIQWAGRRVRLVKVVQRELPDKLIAEAQLDVSRSGAPSYGLVPAQHHHRLTNEWTTEVAIRSDWDEDFYTILHSGEGPGRVRLTFVVNPMMRWIWLGGWIMAAGVLVGLWPAKQGSNRPPKRFIERRTTHKKQVQKAMRREPVATY